MEVSTRDEVEKRGWMILAEKSLEEIWNNEQDELIWKEYL